MNDESLFHLALEKPATERPVFLEQACGGDAALRQRVEALLRSHETPDSFLIRSAENHEATTDSSSSQVAAAQGPGGTDEESTGRRSSAEGSGSRVGPYKLLQPIGEGGMGTVYMAEQTTPVRRTVALKLIKAGMDSRQVLARFGAERQALALMDHPNIAKVFDAGTTDTGRPYFVMELVKGIPITRFCDERRLTLRERLELAIPVCQAVQHAHQKGIIHRDLKPSNVLIALYDGKPVPKVIDFGVAKATGPRLTDQTLYTEFGAVVGTLEYMSPEQAELNQLDIDTRSDIYSLGVLLYELLTGSTPLERKQLKEALFLEILRAIREEESPRPSMRLSTTEELPSIAACRHVEPRKLSGLVRGELDWIVMKALEKDRNRRYETANGLAADLRRYLDDEPVEACPPSMTYRMRKFARRNRGALVTGTVVALALLAAVGGIAGSIGWSVRDRQTRQAALEREVAGALREVGARFRKDDQPEAMSALRRAEGLLASNGGGESIQRQVQSWRTDLDHAARLEEILFTREEEQARLARATNEAYTRFFAEMGIDIDRMSVEQAATLIRPHRILEPLLLALDNWSDKRHDLGFSDPSKVEKSWWQRPMIVAQAVDTDPFRNQVRLAVVRADWAELDRLASDPGVGKLPFSSLRLLSREVFWGKVPRGKERAVALLEEAQIRDPGNFWLNDILSNYLQQDGLGRPEDRLRYAHIAVALRPNSVVIRQELSGAFSDLRRYEDALAHASKAIDMAPTDRAAWLNRGVAHSWLGRLDKAIADYSRSIELDSTYALAWSNRGGCYRQLGQLTKSLADSTKAIELDPKLAGGWTNRSVVYFDLGQLDKTLADSTKAIELNPKSAEAWINRGAAYGRLGRHDEAIAEYSKAIELHPKNATAWAHRGATYPNLGQLDKSFADLSKAIELEPELATAWSDRGGVHSKRGQWDKAIADYSKAIELDPKLAAAWSNRGGAHNGLRQFDPAIADCSKAIELDPKLAMAWTNRGDTYLNLGQLDKSFADLTKAIELEPKSAGTWNIRGCVHRQRGQWNKALADYSKAIDLDPKYAGAWSNLGLVHSESGQFDRAIAECSKAIELDPKLPNAWLVRGDTSRRLGDFGKAVDDYSRGLELAPANTTANNGLAWLFATCPDPKLRNPSRAVELAKKAVELTPKEATHWNTLGVALYRAGDWKQAVESLTKSMELGKGGDGNDWFFLAMAHWQLGDKTQARSWYDKAIPWMEKNQPKNEELVRFRAEAAALLEVNEKQH